MLTVHMYPDRTDARIFDGSLAVARLNAGTEKDVDTMLALLHLQRKRASWFYDKPSKTYWAELERR